VEPKKEGKKKKNERKKRKEIPRGLLSKNARNT